MIFFLFLSSFTFFFSFYLFYTAIITIFIDDSILKIDFKTSLFNRYTMLCCLFRNLSFRNISIDTITKCIKNHTVKSFTCIGCSNHSIFKPSLDSVHVYKIKTDNTMIFCIFSFTLIKYIYYLYKINQLIFFYNLEIFDLFSLISLVGLKF